MQRSIPVSLYAPDDPLDAAVFSVLVELMMDGPEKNNSSKIDMNRAIGMQTDGAMESETPRLNFSEAH